MVAHLKIGGALAAALNNRSLMLQVVSWEVAYPFKSR